MKSIIRFLLESPARVLIIILEMYGKLLSSVVRRDFSSRVQDIIQNKIDSRTQSVLHKNTTGQNINLQLFVPNAVCKSRADTFSAKEPEILRWIDENGDDGTLWDIGANVGLYAIYYAKSKPGRVIAFEPSFFNLQQLVKNIHLNQLSEKIDVMPMPLTDTTDFQDFKLSSLEAGDAMNAFGVDYGYDGTKLDAKLSYRILGISGNDLFEKNILTNIPSLVKIDVDGIEHLILRGMKKVLASDICKSVFVEVNDEFDEQLTQVTALLKESGFHLTEKTHAPMFEVGQSSTTFNQIWFK